MEEVGEVVALTDQTLDFANITPTVRRVGLTVPVSNMAIDNAAFDLMAFVQAKFTIALRIYLAKKLYSQAAWTGNKGPFSGLTKAGDIEIGANAYKNILKAVAKFSDKGFFEGDVVIIMDRETEAELKATPLIANAAGGFVVQDGKCAGYPYIVTHYLNTTLDDGALVPTAKKYIAFGYFEWFALQQHGTVRMTVDATSQAVAKKNLTAVTLNTAWSFTDLSTHINGGAPVTGSDGQITYPTQAFALYEVAEAESSSEI
jgi:HK97 family phage major capsid protein